MFKSLKTVAASITLLAAATAAHAVTTNQYLALPEGFRIGFVVGVVDTMTSDDGVCFPKGVNYTQLFDIVEKNTKENPNLLHMPANIFVAGSMKMAFPCPKQQRENSKIL